ncbi:MAG: SusD/RagB family nutrient-binding outer membrane lipoprotein [Paramuribaculum sp.]|nr:SusD/RagB family nutrient-binding outer membrane lipoprotein [Paramuribaculum sp.]
MKKIIYSALVASLAFGGMLSMQSCGDELTPYPWIKQEEGPAQDEDLAESDMEVLESQLRAAIPHMLNYAHEAGGSTSWAAHKYQYQRSNSIDNYAGYWTTTKANFAFGPALPTLYTENNGYLGGPLDNVTFQYSKSAIRSWDKATYTEIDEATGEKTQVLRPRPEWRAIALICQAYIGHEIVDFYGVCPFNDWRDWKRTTPINYEAGAEVYKQILADLDEAIATLKERQPSPADLQRVEGAMANFTISGWEWQYWVKFANSIKLRMAMNIVDYQDPDPFYGPEDGDGVRKPFVARNIAEEAVKDEIGVLTDADARDIAHHSGGTWNCVYYMLNHSWNDTRLCASLENILKHFNSPLLTTWFSPNTNQIKSTSGVVAPTGIYGVRAGLMMMDTGAPDTGGYGPFGRIDESQKHMKQPFFKRTEAMFLRAEGALRGWDMGGDAKDLYERGIRLSLEEWDCGDQADAYLAQDNLPAVQYCDYYQRTNDCDGRVTVGVKWNDGDPKELKLEKIITQKYIANFPMGAEAWTTYRRTGYPRLFPVKVNNMPSVDTEMQIRRLSFERTENNGVEIEQITQLLGGTQDNGTRVFWDVNSRTWGKDAQGQYIPDNHL